MSKRTFGHALRRLLRARLRDVLACSADAIARGRDAELHRLRIDVKRLRYNLEFVAPLAPADGPLALELLALLQERLGELADAGTFAATYRTMLAGLAESDGRRPGLLALAAAAERERERALAAVRALWTGDAGAYGRRLTASISAVLATSSQQTSHEANAPALPA